MKIAPALLLAACAALALSACDKADNEPGPGGVTVGEARALDEAAEMIESRRLPDAALQASPLPAAGAAVAASSVAPAAR